MIIFLSHQSYIFYHCILNYFFLNCFIIDSLNRLRNDFRMNKNETDPAKIREVSF